MTTVIVRRSPDGKLTNDTFNGGDQENSICTNTVVQRRSIEGRQSFLNHSKNAHQKDDGSSPHLVKGTYTSYGSDMGITTNLAYQDDIEKKSSTEEEMYFQNISFYRPNSPLDTLRLTDKLPPTPSTVLASSSDGPICLPSDDFMYALEHILWRQLELVTWPVANISAMSSLSDSTVEPDFTAKSLYDDVMMSSKSLPLNSFQNMRSISTQTEIFFNNTIDLAYAGDDIEFIDASSASTSNRTSKSIDSCTIVFMQESPEIDL